MAVLSIGDKRLGAVLLDNGYVTDDSLQQAIAQHSDVGGSLADILVDIGVISERRIARAIEESIGIPLVNLTKADIAQDALEKIPADLAEEVRCIPFALEGNRLRVAFQDPLDALSIEDIEDESDCIVEPYKGLSKEVDWALAVYYPELGLEPPADVRQETGKRLGALAYERGFISDLQLNEVLSENQETGKVVGRLLLEKGFINDVQLVQLLAEQARIPYVDSLADAPVDSQLTGKLLRLDAIQFSTVPYREEGGVLIMATSDPRKTADVEAIMQRQVSFVAAPENQVRERIEAMYAGDKGQLGEALLQDKKLKREQLRQAIAEQNKLGRVKSLGEILIDMGYVEEDDVEDALNRQRSGGGRLEDTLVQSGKISPEMLAQSLAMQLGYEFVDLDSFQVDPFVIEMVPEATVRRYNVFPVRLDGNTLVVAMKDPRHVFALDDVKLITGKDIQPAVATDETLVYLINRYYREDTDMDELAKELVAEVGTSDEAEDIDSGLDDNALVRVVNNIIRESVMNDISDIHIEPRPKDVLVRVRKDGSLREYMTLPKATASALSSRIKIMGGLNIAEKRLPQDGRVRYKDKSMTIDLRLSTLPTVYGEKAVMRILKKADNIPEIEKLGFAQHNFQRFTDVIQKPYGMFLITGPTGSGKSFTTFSILKRLAVPEKNVTTVEDPVEYEIPGINQTQTNNKAGLNFAAALKSFLRQDPDIIMVGEIRDTETASTAVEAALTGHLLIATLHTNDAAGVVTRLEEMGVESFNISASLLGVLAQRLVRRICKDCRTEYTPDPDVMRQLGVSEEDIAGKKLFRGVGCEKCGGTGYRGRMAIHELLINEGEVQSAITKGLPSNDIKEVARKEGMLTLREDGILKVFEGDTTLEEILAKTAN